MGFACWITTLLSIPTIGASEAPQATKEAAAKDTKQMIGNWKALSVERAILGRDAAQSKKTTVEITDKKLVYRFLRNRDRVFTYSLDPAVEPKAINLVVAEGDDAGTLMECIYKFDDGHLILVMGKPGRGNRPTKFTLEKETEWLLIVLEKKTE